MGKFRDDLLVFGACREALAWVGDRSFTDAWSTCERGGWMLWLVRSMGMLDNRTAVKLACAFARRVLYLAAVGEEGQLNAILKAERWLSGDAATAHYSVDSIVAETAADDAATLAVIAGCGFAEERRAQADIIRCTVGVAAMINAKERGWI